VGSNYLMKMNPSFTLECSHPFTSFKNRAGNCDFLLNARLHKTRCYTHGAIIRTFHNERRPRIGGEERSHTEKMAHAPLSSLSIWGPFQGHVTNIIPRSMPNGQGPEKQRNIVLAGSGSAINYMIDLMSQLSCATNEDSFHLGSDKLKQVILLYSTRDRDLYNWVVNVIDNLLGDVDMRFKDIDRPKIRILLACTSLGIKTSLELDRTFELGEDFSRESIFSDEEEKDMKVNIKQNHLTGSIELISKRIDYSREIPDESYVFCQGSAGFNAVVAEGCHEKKGVRLFLDQ
jgi:hypothetical protein